MNHLSPPERFLMNSRREVMAEAAQYWTVKARWRAVDFHHVTTSAFDARCDLLP
jgi:hypothetical protein